MINVLKALRGVINIAPWILLVGVVYVLIKFLNKDGVEPDALGGDKDEALAQDIAQGMDAKED